jgi:nitrite reductase/ring-hydroxylating ferredoxin subunit
MRTDSNDIRTLPAAPETGGAVPHAGCAAHVDRRAFLRQSATAVAASLVAIGLSPTAGFAEAVHELVAEGAVGVERSYVLPARDGVWVDAGSSLALARVGAVVFAFSLECPHRGRQLEWLPGEQRFYCPKHKARFTANGAHASGRRTTDLDRFAIRVAQGRVIVTLDQPLSADTDKAAWDAAVLVL